MNEGLMIQVESLERDVVDRDKLVSSLQADVCAARRDLDWLLQIGVVRIVDKLIEHPDFTNAISLIRHAAYVAGVESVQKTSSGGESGEAGASSLSVGPVVSVSDALLSFASMDHAGLLGLGEMGIDGLRELCSFGSEGTPEDVAGREMVLVNDIGVGGNVKDHGASGDDRACVRGDDVDEVVDDREVSGGLAGKVGEDDVVEGVVVGDKAVGDGSEP